MGSSGFLELISLVCVPIVKDTIGGNQKRRKRKMNKQIQEDVELTSEQHLELAKIRTMGLQGNKDMRSIKQRQKDKRESKKAVIEFWNFLGVEYFGGADE